MSQKLIVLDRDGVINQESTDFVKTPDEWQPLPGSLEAIALLSSSGFTVAVASNQSGVARGLLDTDDLDSIHAKMHAAVGAAGGSIDRVVFCPHHPDDDCDCRKPLPGLLQQLADHYGQSMRGVPFIGDSERDLQAAVSIGARPVLVLTGNGRRTAAAIAASDREIEFYADLLGAAKSLVAEQSESD